MFHVPGVPCNRQGYTGRHHERPRGGATKYLYGVGFANDSPLFEEWCAKCFKELEAKLVEQGWSFDIQRFEERFGRAFIYCDDVILVQLSKTQRELFLETLVSLNPNYYWSYSGTLVDVLPSTSLSAEFLANWLPRLAAKEGDDLAGENAFAIVFAYSCSNPGVGIRIIQRYMGEDEDNIKGIILQGR